MLAERAWSKRLDYSISVALTFLLNGVISGHLDIVINRWCKIISIHINYPHSNFQLLQKMAKRTFQWPGKSSCLTGAEKQDYTQRNIIFFNLW